MLSCSNEAKATARQKAVRLPPGSLSPPPHASQPKPDSCVFESAGPRAHRSRLLQTDRCQKRSSQNHEKNEGGDPQLLMAGILPCYPPIPRVWDCGSYVSFCFFCSRTGRKVGQAASIAAWAPLWGAPLGRACGMDPTARYTGRARRTLRQRPRWTGGTRRCFGQNGA